MIRGSAALPSCSRRAERSGAVSVVIAQPSELLYAAPLCSERGGLGLALLIFLLYGACPLVPASPF